MGLPSVTDDQMVSSWRDLQRSTAQLQRGLDRAVESAGVDAQWFAVLHLLLSADGHRLPMSVLAREMSLTSGGITKLADRMARGGLIDRRGSAQDRRVVYAALTEPGEAAARRGVVSYTDWLRSAVLTHATAEQFTTAAATIASLSPGRRTADEDASAEEQIETPRTARSSGSVERRRQHSEPTDRQRR